MSRDPHAHSPRLPVHALPADAGPGTAQATPADAILADVMPAGVPVIDRMVHDLKGPLAPLQTAAYLLGREDLPAERRHELLATLDRQSRRLARMIDEAGDWMRAAQDALVTRRAPVELGLLLDLSIGTVPGCASVAEVPEECAQAQLWGDAGRLQQLLVTLIQHAAARDPSAPPQLWVRVQQPWLELQVGDAGPTPDPLSLAALFQQPQPEPSDAGLGLRLMIAAAVARAHGGTLHAQARDGGGLVVVLRLPYGDPRAG